MAPAKVQASLLLLAAALGSLFCLCQVGYTVCSTRSRYRRRRYSGATYMYCDDYCCSKNRDVFCCSDCELSMNSGDCNYKNYWRYFGYAVGCLVLLALLVGVGFCLTKAIKSVCCKKRSTVVRSEIALTMVPATTPSRSVGPSTSSAVTSPPSYSHGTPAGMEEEGQQLPKKPPEYYEIFSVHPPPPYTERDRVGT